MRDYKNIVNQVIDIIHNEAENEKSKKFIRYSIEDYLNEKGLEDIRHFDRKHFSEVTNSSLSNYINDVLFEQSIRKYERVKNIRKKFDGVSYNGIYNFKKKYLAQVEGKIMSKYLCCLKNYLDDIDSKITQEHNSDFITITAESKDEAIRKYIEAEYKSQQEWFIQLSIFDYFCGSIYDGDEIFNSYDKITELCKLRDKIRESYQENIDVWELIPENVQMTQYMQDLFRLLSPSEKISFYYEAMKYNVVCLELTTLATFKNTIEKTRKNVIVNATQNDLTFFNTLARLIRLNPDSEKYLVNLESFERNGYSDQQSRLLFDCVISRNINHVISEEVDFGFLFSSLILSYKYDLENSDCKVYIEPSPLLRYLSVNGYDFREKKSENFIKLMAEYSKIDPS